MGRLLHGQPENIALLLDSIPTAERKIPQFVVSKLSVVLKVEYQIKATISPQRSQTLVGELLI